MQATIHAVGEAIGLISCGLGSQTWLREVRSGRGSCLKVQESHAWREGGDCFLAQSGSACAAVTASTKTMPGRRRRLRSGGGAEGHAEAVSAEFAYAELRRSMEGGQPVEVGVDLEGTSDLQVT